MSARQIVLDTETTGLSAADGHRIIEIGCVELVNRRLTGRTLHRYLNPERDIDEGAMAVHGMSREMLADKPRFAEIADEFLAFVAGAEVLIHNASFDVGFLDAELGRLSGQRFASHVSGVIDTLAMARELHPGRRNSLDALCDRYGVSNAHRKLHGALLDAELLADVYLALTRGQDSLEIPGRGEPSRDAAGLSIAWPPAGLVTVEPDADERAAHEALLQDMARERGEPALWVRLDDAA
ncbi:MAG: DNA polymerase III subunit epsilon [Burkholderiaceae bacterium]